MWAVRRTVAGARPMSASASRKLAVVGKMLGVEAGEQANQLGDAAGPSVWPSAGFSESSGEGRNEYLAQGLGFGKIGAGRAGRLQP